MTGDGETGSFPALRAGGSLPRLIGLACALVALAACVLGRAEPLTCAIRAAIAYLSGFVLTHMWYVFIATRRINPQGIEVETGDEGD